MNLDDISTFKTNDPQDMLAQIDGLPLQLETAWALSKGLTMPEWEGIRQVVVTGMGGSAIGADLVAAWAAQVCTVPVLVLRDYDLPAWASGSETLVIASSHSGNTEETLSAFGQALERGCRGLAVTTGGKLAQEAGRAGAPLWKFEHQGQPRTAVGFSFALILAALVKLGFVPDPQVELEQALEAMRSQQASIQADVPAVQNLAKRLAGQLVGRWVAFFGAGVLAPVARRWKGQVSELAKAWGQFEFLPEADHNTLAGIMNPEELFSKTMMMFLRAPSDHPRNRLRLELTRKSFMLEGLNTDFVDAQGEGRMAHQWTCLHMGDYVAYYLAMAYGVDPTPVEALENFKMEMKAAGE